MKNQFNLRECAYRRQVVENDTFMHTINDKIYFYADEEIVAELRHSYLEDVIVDKENNKIVNTYTYKVIKEMTFNSELKRKNKFRLDGNSFVYKGDVYICLDNEDWEIEEYLQYDHDTYKSYCRVLHINGKNIWIEINRSVNKFNEDDKDELDKFFKDNSLCRDGIYADRLLMLSDEKKQILINLLQK